MRLSLLLTLTLLSSASEQTYLGRSADHWLKQLRDGDVKERRSAAFALGKIGHARRDVLQGLNTALQDRDASLRDAAAFALGDIAAKYRAEVWDHAGEDLLRRMNDEEPSVRRSAAYALGMCRAGRTSEDALIRALNDRNATVRRSAAFALGKGAPAVSPDAVAALIACLRKEDDALALRDIAGALGAIGRPGAAEAAEPLARAMQLQRDPVARKTALASLMTLMGPEMAKAKPGTHDALVGILRDALRTGDGELRGLVAGALDNLGDHAAPALQDLADLVEDERVPDASRRNAVVALTKLWPTIRKMTAQEASGIIRTLSKALEPRNPDEVRKFTAEALAKIGFPHIEPAAAQLLNAIEKDRDDVVRHRCVWSFLNCDDLVKIPNAVRTLRGALKDTHNGIKYDAARCLARALASDAGTDVIDALDEMLHDPKIKVYNQTNTDVKGGSETTKGGSSLAPDLGGDARYMAAQGLGFIGTSARRAHIVKTLREMTTSTDEKTRQSAEQALKNLGG
jgi:HEAT repeat protein